MAGLNEQEMSNLESFLIIKDRVEKQLSAGLNPSPTDILYRNALDLWLSMHLWFWRSNYIDDGKGEKK